MEPILNFLHSQVPILNDFGVHETFQDLGVQAGLISSDVNNAINQISNFDSFVTEISNNGGHAVIPLGTIDLTQSLSNGITTATTPAQFAFFVQGAL